MFNKKFDSCNFANLANIDAYAFLKSLEQTVPIIWLDRQICKTNLCNVKMNKVGIYQDGGHLSVAGSRELGTKEFWIDEIRRVAQ
jgi:SGNH domain (fused to AT3 domains)